MSKKRDPRPEEEEAEASESGGDLGRWSKGKRRTVAATSAARSWRQGKFAEAPPEPLADKPSEPPVDAPAETPAEPAPIEIEVPQPPDERPDWGRDEMSLFFGVLALALSELAVFVALPLWGRVLAALLTTIIAIPLVSRAAPRINSLVGFLTRPHSLSEYGSVFGRAWRWKARDKNWMVKRIVVGVLFLAIVVAWAVVFPRQVAAVNAAREDAARERSATIAAAAEDLIDTQPGLALLVAIEARRVHPTDAARGALIAALERRRNLELTLRRPVIAESVAASPDGTMIVSGHGDGAVVVWDAGDGSSRDIEDAHLGDVFAVTFSPDGRHIASAGTDGVIRIWDVQTLEPVTELTHHVDVIWDLAYTADGGRLVSAGDDGWRVWSFSEGQTFRVETGRMFAVALDGTSSRVVIGRVGFAEVVDLDTNFRVGEPLELAGQVRSVAFRPGSDRVIVAAGEDGRLVRWDVETSEQGEFGSHIGLSSLIADEGGRRLATAGDGSVRIWDAAGRQIIPAETLPMDGASTLAFVGSDDLAVASELEIDVVTLVETQPLAVSLADDVRPVWALTVDAERTRAASGHAQGEVRLWDVGSGKPIPLDTAALHDSTVQSIAFSQSGSHLATGDHDGNLVVWNLDQDTPTPAALEATGVLVRDVVFGDAGNRLISGHADGEIRIWDSSDGSLTLTAQVQEKDGIWAVAHHPNRDVIAVAGEAGAVTLRDSQTGEVLATSDAGHAGTIRDVVFSPDGRTLASGGDDGFVMRWDADTLVRIDFENLGKRVWALAYSADGRALGVAEDDHLTILDQHLERVGVPMSGHRSSIQGLEFVPGFTVLTGSPDGSIRRWELGFTPLTARACVVANRNLSQAEWDELRPGEDYVRHCRELPPGVGAPSDAPEAVFMGDVEDRS